MEGEKLILLVLRWNNFFLDTYALRVHQGNYFRQSNIQEVNKRTTY